MTARRAAIAAALVTVVAVILFGLNQSSQAGPTSGHTGTHHHPVTKVTICHFTSIHASHPYVQITIPARQIVTGEGHGSHVYDIWGSFLFVLDGRVVQVPSHGDQSILRNRCHTPGEGPPPSTATATATVTSTATATATVTATSTVTATVTGPTSTVTATPTGGPFVPSTGCPPPNLFNVIRGTRGNDTLVGTPCRDALVGHHGNDRLYGAGNTDLIIGGRGNDRLVGGQGPDALRGGFGNDRLIATDGTPGDRLVGGVGRDRCVIDRGDHARQCETVVRR